MTIFIVEFATPEYDETVHLRYNILRKPLGLDFTEEQLSAEFSDFHLAAYDEQWLPIHQQGRLRGCLVLTPKSDKILKMRQVAVDTESQGKGIGSLLVKASEAFARQNGYDTIELNARDTAVPFYEKLKYSKEGDMFVEVGIPHYKMVKYL